MTLKSRILLHGFIFFSLFLTACEGRYFTPQNARMLQQQTVYTRVGPQSVSPFVNRQQLVNRPQQALARTTPAMLPTLGQVADKQIRALAASRAASLQKRPSRQTKPLRQPQSLSPSNRLENVRQAIKQNIRMLPSGIRDFYRKNNYNPFWHDGTDWLPLSIEAARDIDRSLIDGLPMKRYHAFGPFNLKNGQTAQEIAGVDFALTNASYLYLVDLSDGLDPARRKANGLSRLKNLFQSKNWQGYINTLRPKNKHYAGLSRVIQSGALTKAQLKTLMINMERFRHYQEPKEKRYIHVNLPTQTLVGYEQGQDVLTMPVVIGQLTRQTPVMKDYIKDLKFSPDWSVPASIARKDILPVLAKKGASFAKAMGLEVFRGKRKINPDTINWKKAKASSFRFRQPPGPTNALGGVRFSLTNPRGIYLHDTPSRDLFLRGTRVVSSGCVRVGNATELASWLLRDAGWSKGKIKKAMSRGKTRIVSLKKRVPVYFSYNTAQINHEGKLEMGRDIYGLDAALGIKLGLY